MHFSRNFLSVQIDTALNSAQNAFSHASGASDTAENEPKWVFLKDSLRKTVQWPIDIDRYRSIDEDLNLHVCWKKRCFIEPNFISILNYGIGGGHKIFLAKSEKFKGLILSLWHQNVCFWSIINLKMLVFLWKHAKFKGLISALWHQNVYFWSIISLWIWAFSCKTYADTDLRSVVEDRIKVSLTPVFIEVKKHVSGFWRDFQYFSTLYRRCLVRFCSFWTFIRSLLPCVMKQKN